MSSCRYVTIEKELPKKRKKSSIINTNVTENSDNNSTGRS